MRLIKINPFKKTVERCYFDLEQAIINFHVQSSELMVMPLGQEHMLWLDNKWAVRENQEFFGMKNVDGVLGGIAVITGREPETADGIANCGLPVEGVRAQFFFLGRAKAERHPAVEAIRNGHNAPLLKKETVLRGIPTTQ